MQAAAKAKLLQYPPPPVLTPQLITAASVISTRLYGLFDLGVFIAKLVEAGVQRYGEPLDPCWLYIVLPNGYKHFAYFSNDVPEAAGTRLSTRTPTSARCLQPRRGGGRSSGRLAGTT